MDSASHWKYMRKYASKATLSTNPLVEKVQCERIYAKFEMKSRNFPLGGRTKIYGLFKTEMTIVHLQEQFAD